MAGVRTKPNNKDDIVKNKEGIANNKDEIAKNTADIAVNQDEIEALKKRLDDLVIPDPQLACVTGVFNASSMSVPGITNQMNITVNDPFEVFTTFDDSDVDDHPWGLLCNGDDGWINTGCSAANNGKIDGTNNDWDAMQRYNGCTSDNDEYDELDLYTTCCKVIN